MRCLLTSVKVCLVLALLTGLAWSAPPGSRGGHGGGGGGGHSGGHSGGYHHGHDSTGEILFGVGAILGGVGAITNSGPGYYAAPQPVYVQPQPVYVQPQPAYAQPQTAAYEPEEEQQAVAAPANPPSAPPKKTSIKIVNPKTNTATLSYTLDGQVYQIKPGETQDLEYEYEIAFDRGNGGASVRYSLTKGVYTFTPTAEGTWELYNSDK